MAQSSAEPAARRLHRRALPPARARTSTLDRGDTMAALRREELQAPHVRIRAAGTARGLASGCVFKLEGFPREDQNDEHVVLRADYRLVDPEHMTAAAADAETYRVALVVAPAALPYRPPRLTPRPVMRGPQTATVVGPTGEEIYTDKYGRVKVQFHWDRLGKRDENSSCCIRVSATWAGAQLGLHPDPAHRPGGDRRLPRGRPRPADHHRPGLQRRADAALRAAGQRDAVGLEVELLARRRRLQRAALRGQEGVARRSTSRPRRTTTSWSRTTRAGTSGTTGRKRSSTTRPSGSAMTGARPSTTPSGPMSRSTAPSTSTTTIPRPWATTAR